MRNFKHTLAAMLAVVMIGSLALTQAADIKAAKANKMDDDNEYLSVSEVSESDNQEAITIEEKTLEPIDFKDYELDFVKEKFEDLRPFEPVAGYVITTTGNLNIRARESFDSEILGSITYGQMIDIIDETDEWYGIPYCENDGVGYV